jgi:ATP-binding cassette, subfamily C, bacterial EexD
MQQLIRTWTKYMIFAGIFTTAFNLVYLAVPLYMLVVHDRVLFSFSTATLFSLGAGLAISLAVMATLEYMRNRIMAQAGDDLVRQMTPQVVTSMQADAGALVPQGYTRGLADLEQLRDAVVQGRFFRFLDLPWILVYLFVLYLMHPLVGITAVAGVFMAAAFQFLLKQIETKRYTLSDAGAAANRALVSQAMGCGELVSSMGLARHLAQKFQGRDAGVQDLKSRAERFHAGIGAAIHFVHLVFLTGVFTAGTWVFFNDEITVGGMFAAVMIAVRIMMSLEKGLSDIKASIDAVNATKRLKQFVGQAQSAEKTVLPEPAGKIQVRGLSLPVPGKLLLNNIHLDLAPGQMLGVTGPGDAGKTVLCRVLAGIWPPGAGEFRLDGAKIDQWPEEALGRYIGYMPQEPDLLPGTVAQNIARFAEKNDAQVIRAAEIAGVHDMILQLPRGYETQVVQTGRHLSAGRRQLISLARALYGLPRLVVMDDPHTFLDEAGLRILQQVLDTLKKEKITTVIVTDRPAMLKTMDKLLVIKNGQSAMYGPTTDVMAQLANRPQTQHQTAGV